MASIKSCARCGAEMRLQNAEGFCTRCLLESGLEEPPPETQVAFSAQNQERVTSSDLRRSDNHAGPGRLFGDYELLEEIARGGMGIVYRARQLSLGRIVAVKMILAGQFASQQIIQRFRGEVTAAALLQHPNIVAIHDVGIHDDQHYFSMAYVEGQNLSQLVGNRPLPAARAARYAKLIAEAIQYAHDQGILHRDLKPSNILIDSATDQPRLTDFGLAKRLDDDASITVTGQVLGSPSFMPPEQACSDRGKVGRHSDVYGLGAILYYLLTARPPFQADSLASIVTLVLRSEPLAPRTLNSSVPRDLETICLKCLSKEPSKRYATAGAVAEELGRYIKDEPILARPATRTEKAWRWCRRNPVVATLGTALCLAIALGITAVTWQFRQVRQAELRARQDLYTADMNRAHQFWEEGSLERAREFLDKHAKDNLRGFEWRYLTNLCQDESRFTFTNVNFSGEFQGLALDPDGKTAIAASGDSLKWLDGQTQREVQTRTVGTTALTGLSAATDGSGLVAYRAGRVKVLSPTSELLLGASSDSTLDGKANHLSEGSSAFALSRDGALLAEAHNDHTVQIFDGKTGQPLGPAVRLDEIEDVFALAFSPDAKFLVCAVTDIYVLELPTLKLVKRFAAHTAFIHCLAFDRTGTKLASGGGDGHIRIWNFPDCTRLEDLAGHQGWIGDLAFSPDGRRLASGGTDHTVRLWDLDLRGPPTFLRGHRGNVTSILFSKDGNQLYSGSADQTVKVWDVSERPSPNLLRHANWTDQVDFSPDGKLLAVADFKLRKAVLWTVRDRSSNGIVGDHAVSCRGVKFSADGQLLATYDNAGTVQVWGGSPRTNVFTVHEVKGAGGFAFHPSKPILALACGDVRFRDRHNKTLHLLEDSPTQGVRSVVFSQDGKWTALGTTDGRVSIWDLPTGRFSREFRSHAKAIDLLCFSHNGHWLASGGRDQLVVLYALDDGSPPRPLPGHHGNIAGLAFAPGDKTLVSTSWDGTIRFWSLANHQVALTLYQGGGPVNGVTFSPDGNLMATAGSDGTVRLWPAAKDGFENRTASSWATGK